MKILVVGDIIGKTGLAKTKEVLAKLKQENNIDFIIANGENIAEGMGITKDLFNELIRIGINSVTLGNHTWAKKDIFTFIDDEKIIRPANLPTEVPGKGYSIYMVGSKKVAVVNLIGRVDINILSDNPFLEADRIINKIKNDADIIFVDFHAEATAEKIAMAYHLDGRVTALFGTHTHVQTADECILEKGTGYITDVGMTGPKKSVIGMDVESSLKRFLTTLPEKYKIASGDCIFNGAIFELNDEDCRIKKISRIIL